MVLLDDPLSQLCPAGLCPNQHDRQIGIGSSGETHSKIFFSETTYPHGIKLGHNSPWVVPFHNYVRQVRIRSKMAASGEHSIIYGSMGQSKKHGPGER